MGKFIDLVQLRPEHENRLNLPEEEEDKNHGRIVSVLTCFGSFLVLDQHNQELRLFRLSESSLNLATCSRFLIHFFGTKMHFLNLMEI